MAEGLDGYSIDVGAYRGELATLETELGEVETANGQLDTAVETCKTAVTRQAGQKVADALDHVNLAILAANAAAAHQRGENARKGAGQIATAYVRGDESMEDDARALIDQVPDFHERG